MVAKTRRHFLQSLLASAFVAQGSVTDHTDARAALLRGMQQVMGTLPHLPTQPPAYSTLPDQLQAASDKFTRTKILYESEAGDTVPAWLLMPRNLKRRVPAMLCLHQTTKIGKDEPVGLGGNANLHYGRELTERGYVCLVPDYPYLGENQFDPYARGYVSCTMKGVVNHLRAVSLLQSLPQVNKSRIGCIGHSLGGHNALFLAAFDVRVKAVVTSCGFTSFRKYHNGDLTGWEGKRYMPLIASKFGKDPARMPFDFPQLLAALAPRALFINAPLRDSNFDVSGVRDCVVVAQPVYEKVFKAADRLVVEYPDAPHDFPTDVRLRSYAFLDRWLKS